MLIDVPLRIGDTVYGVRRVTGDHFRIIPAPAAQIYFSPDMKVCVWAYNACRGELGKNVFLTYDDAKKEIERRIGK